MTNLHNICDYIISQNYTVRNALRAIEIALANPKTSREVRGQLGELAVAYTLLGLKKQNPNTKLFQSVLLKKPDSDWTTEIDFLYVTPYALYVIEVKSYFGTTEILPNLKFSVNTKQNKTEYDVIYQNQGHCKTVYELIYNYVKSPEFIKPVVTLYSLGNLIDKRSDEDRLKYPVLNIENLYNYIAKAITKANNRKLTPTVNVAKCSELIAKNNIQSEENMLQHINRINSHR